MDRTIPSRIRDVLRRMFGWLKIARRDETDFPEDPFAYVTAPKKPRPSDRSAAAVADLPEE
jgi:hypothetical protein